jgi:bifunctional NMN adenylyltransferase/nudix hydrolase
VQEYRTQWARAPYPPTFVTVDAVVVQAGHVLLVRRKEFPGEGQWALPGGFVQQNETLRQACIRELMEETKISFGQKIKAERVLEKSIVRSQVFDDPYRSVRGRTITHAFLIHLAPSTTLPFVEGSDDAKEARWWHLADVRPEMMFEDHASIIANLTGGL